jgi:uncharacterized protein (TIGR02145 family)
MKTIKFLNTSFSILLLFMTLSCSKKNTKINPVQPVTGATVTINGVAYPTDTIGNQVWTTQNYSGQVANMLHDNGADSLTTGNYYCNASLSSINLPSGWRIPTVNDFNVLLGNYSSNPDQNGNIIANMMITEGLLAKTAWTGIAGTNSTGFNAYPAGYINVIQLLRKNFVIGPGKVVVYLSSNLNGYYDSEDGGTPPSSLVLKLSSTSSMYNFYTYYAGIETLSNDPDNAIGYGSIRFVKDK